MMRTTLKLTLGALAVVALAGVGVASAQGYGPLGYGPGKAHAKAIEEQCDLNITVGECRAILGDPCNDAMTVGDCKAAWEAKRADEKAQRQAACVERTGNETFCSQLASRPPPPPGGPRHGGHEGPGGRPPPPRDEDSYNESAEPVDE